MTIKIANSADYPGVSILFADPSITYLFAELLEVHGLNTEILTDASQICPGTKVVTEPQFFPMIPESMRRQCLVVGNKEVLKNIDAVTLSRPLTEDKIDTAISQFLSS